MFLQIPTPDLATDSIVSNASKELSTLKSMSLDDLVNKLTYDIVQFAIHLGIAIVVFYVGKFIIKKLYSVTDRIMTGRKVDRSLTTFILSLVRIVLYFILIVTIISILGIETSSFIAIFASAGVAIGMALSGTLQNFAGGVLILLLKPYKIGDYIEAQGFQGTVTEIQIFNTIISTPDNKSIIIPNGGLSTGSINNWSREDFRRIDWTVGISYGNSVEDARQKVLAMFAEDRDIVKTTFADYRLERAEEEAEQLAQQEQQQQAQEDERRRSWIYRLFHRHHRRLRQQLDEPMLPTPIADRENIDRSPVILLSELGDSAVVLTIRAWAKSKNYWNVYFKYNERFYNELPTCGIEFPFPQLDVHLPK